MLTVTVNDRPLDVAAVVENGRVLLPLRAAFAALGASIRYDSQKRIIVARSAARTLRLDVRGLRVIANRTYVPLRFVAQSLGAVVGYDSHAQLVTIVLRAAGNGTRVVALTPSEGAAVSSAYPTISASLAAANAVRDEVSLVLDGADVTQLATFDGATITYIPRGALSSGRHTVVFSGRTLANDPFSEQWSFDTTLGALPEDGAPAFSNFDYRFYSNGSAFYSGQSIHFTLLAPPGGTARVQLCNLGYEYPLWNAGYGGMYEADIPAPLGYWIPSCPVTAVYTAWNGAQTYVPIPLVIGVYTQPSHDRHHHRSTATPAPRGIEPMPRRLEPTPAPTPRPAPAAVRTAAPAPAPIPSARPDPVRPVHPPPAHERNPRPRQTP